MSTTITATTSGDTTTPVAVDGYEAERVSQNIVHDLISGGIAVTLIEPRPRSGTLQLVYGNEEDALGAFNLHAQEDTFELVQDDVTGINMTYVLDGALRITLGETRKEWTVSVGFQEVTL